MLRSTKSTSIRRTLLGLLALILFASGCSGPQSVSKSSDEVAWDSELFQSETKQYEEFAKRLKEKGPYDIDAWRYATLKADDPRFEVNAWGTLALQALMEAEPKLKPVAVGMMEATLLKSDPKEIATRYRLLLQYRNMLDMFERSTRPTPAPKDDPSLNISPPDSRDALHMGKSVLAARVLSRDSRSFATKRLEASDPAERRFALPILLASSTLTTKERNWAIAQTDSQISNSKGNEQRFWRTVRLVLSEP